MPHYSQEIIEGYSVLKNKEKAEKEISEALAKKFEQALIKSSSKRLKKFRRWVRIL